MKEKVASWLKSSVCSCLQSSDAIWHVFQNRLLSHCVQKGIGAFYLGNQISHCLSLPSPCAWQGSSAPSSFLSSLPSEWVFRLSQIQNQTLPPPLFCPLTPPSPGSGFIHSLMQDLFHVRSLSGTRDMEADRVPGEVNSHRKLSMQSFR